MVVIVSDCGRDGRLDLEFLQFVVGSAWGKMIVIELAEHRDWWSGERGESKSAYVSGDIVNAGRQSQRDE